MWKSEAGKGRKDEGETTYMLCCAFGKVQLPSYKQADLTYENLFKASNPKSKLSGENYHTMRSLLPINGLKPKFAQLYIYDTDNEVSNRQTLFSGSKNLATSTSNSLDTEIVEDLKGMLDSKNELVKVYRMAKYCFHENPNVNLKLRLIGRRQNDGRTYNLPTASEVAGLIIGDIGDSLDNRDIIVEKQAGNLMRISELHPSYLPLQYPLLFPRGEDGYRVDIPHRQGKSSKKKKDSKVSMREWFAYRIQDKETTDFSLILNSRRLLQQFLVDAYTMIESEQLYYIRNKQKDLRCESYQNLHNIQITGNENMSSVGQRVILPSSFTGGARYMMQNYLDAMSICKWYGYPDYFITITCNPKWPEVTRFLKDTSTNPEDRPDVLCRIFKIKLDSIIHDLKDNSLLERVSAVVYTVEFQKSGLPHAHICLFMHADHKIYNVEYIDQFIYAEIPDKHEDVELFTLVGDFMIHGPCGNTNPKCPCMIEGNCSKQFPKRIWPTTTTDTNGFPIYRRRDSGLFVEKSGVKLDNRSVVPYNKTLLKRYQAHINVEWCNQAGSIKYLFKYINKGPDRATVVVVQGDNEADQQNQKDEIKEYYDCRYISACEASWRIYSYDVHYRTPSVIRLPFHLPGQQQVIFEGDDDIDNVLNKPYVASSMFLGWMKCNEEDEVARELNYVEFPTKLAWKADQRCWSRRKKAFSIGCIHAVSPSTGESYFLKILLNKVKGPTSFLDIRTVNGQLLPTFRDACYSLGLLDDDMEYIEAIREASHSGSGYYLHNLFSAMLLSNTLSRPDHVWEHTWKFLADGILHTQERILGRRGLSLPDDQIKNITLLQIEKFLLQNNSSLRRFECMPYPDNASIASASNRLIHDEWSYDATILEKDFDSQLSSLTAEQRLVFDEIIQSVECDKGGVFFVYGYGGTGKTFLWKTLSAAIRRRGEIVLNVASSGIDSLLLCGGRTAHSRFHIPLNLNEDSLCYIKPDSDDAQLLKETN